MLPDNSKPENALDVTMTDNDAQWDEDRGGPRSSRNWISFPKGGDFYNYTKDALDWTEPGARDPGRMLVPSIQVEALFRRAPVNNPIPLNIKKFLTHCLDVEGFLKDALQLLIDNGLLTEEDADGEEQPRSYKSFDELVRISDRLVLEMIDNPALEVKADSWEWLEGHTPNAATLNIDWLAALSIATLTEKTKDLTLYIDLALMMGERSTEAVRIKPDAIFWTMAGGSHAGGLLTANVAQYFYSTASGAVMTPAFLLNRVCDFLVETQWPRPYLYFFDKLENFSYDLPRRTNWQTATRQQWCVIVQDKLPTAIRLDLPTHFNLFEDFLDEPPKLVEQVQSVGDLVLTGESAQKLPFRTISDIEDKLTKDFQGLIKSERDAGHGSSEIVHKVKERLKAAQQERRSDGAEDGEVFGVKRGQLARAYATPQFTKLEAEFTPLLQGDRGGLPMSNDAKLVMIKKLLTSGTVLPHTVIFATKGMKISVYLAAGSDFMALIHGERHLIDLYFGASLSYDEDLGCVPEALKTYRLNAGETEKVREFRWVELDFLNNVFLEIRGKSAGTHFRKYKTGNLYHDCDMIRHVIDLFGKLFESIGYPRTVPEEEGMSFRTFMGHILQIVVFAMALTLEEQKGALMMVDRFVIRGYTAAQEAGKRLVYGASPAESTFRAWLSKEETVIIELKELRGTMGQTATFRRHMGLIVGSTPQAATLQGFVADGAGPSGSSTGVSGNGQQGNSSSRTSRGKAKNNKGANKGASKGGRGKQSSAVTPSSQGAGQGPKGAMMSTPAECEAMGLYLFNNFDFSIGERAPTLTSHTWEGLSHRGGNACGEGRVATLGPMPMMAIAPRLPLQHAPPWRSC